MRRAALALVLSLASFPAALAQTAQQARQRQTPDWPCRAIKVAEISLPAVWSGPSIEAVKTAAWRDDPALNSLIEKLAPRRTPMDLAEALVRSYAEQAGAAKPDKLLALFAGLYEAMANERGQVVAGLDRFGRRQKELADQIRAETAQMRAAQDDATASPDKIQDLVNRLAWDMRIFEDKRKSVTYVCETPVLIEQRLFALGRVIQGLME